mgnify:FL=1
MGKFMLFDKIKERKRPPVSGVDLEHSLNYISARGIPLEWFYSSFTAPEAFYRSGSCKYLERIVENHISLEMTCLSKIDVLVNIVRNEMPHYSTLGLLGPTDRGIKEEELLLSGEGWCNEQARAFLALTQIAGYPSRLVFASCEGVGAHVLSEVYIHDRWILVDQTEAFIFVTSNGTPVNVMDIKQFSDIWQDVDKLYKARLMENRSKAINIDFWDTWVPYSLVENPLRLFTNVGYCNYFIH